MADVVRFHVLCVTFVVSGIFVCSLVLKYGTQILFRKHFNTPFCVCCCFSDPIWGCCLSIWPPTIKTWTGNNLKCVTLQQQLGLRRIRGEDLHDPGLQKNCPSSTLSCPVFPSRGMSWGERYRLDSACNRVSVISFPVDTSPVHPSNSKDSARMAVVATAYSMSFVVHSHDQQS